MLQARDGEQDRMLAKFPSEGKASILVVDDSAFQRSRLKDLLQSAGYAILEAGNGQEALDVLEKTMVDLILLDVVMPVMDGCKLCEIVKSSPAMRPIPVIMVTSLQSREDKLRGIEAGADEYLRKPWSALELLARVRSLLRARRLLGELEQAENVISAMVKAIEAKDPSAVGHSERVGTLAARTARKLRLKDEDVVILMKAGRLHDVGKIGVREAILLKPGPLTPTEKREVERHPVVGEEICKPLQFALPVLDLIRHHHERMDGSGYPDGLVARQITPLVRILGLVDAYDAMTSSRSYRQAMRPEDALGVLKGSKKSWDRDVLTTFESVVSTIGPSEIE